ncbi:MAG: tRNA threonylcarbamoyladenosine dehydratase [Bacilli bacterium]|jgi:tRNA A37 threonylcarbamoyladenosine dehydratase
MEQDRYTRSEMLIGKEKQDALRHKRVAVFGLGGVGGYAVESLARAGIGTLDLFDGDTFSFSNLNRQILATEKTVGRKKTEVAKERVWEIDPNTAVNLYDLFLLPGREEGIPFSSFDYIVDAIDTVSAKILLAKKAKEFHIPLISCLGCGRRLDPTKLKIGDVFATSGDPLAKVLRHELRKEGIASLKVCYSEEPPAPVLSSSTEPLPPGKKSVPGSMVFVPATAGILIGYEVVKDLLDGMK